MHGVGDVATFDRLAGLYDRLMPPTDPSALGAGLDRATRPIQRGVDLAGGSGRAAMALDGVDWTVVDAATGMLQQARAKGLSTVCGDAGRLPLRTEAVDAVVVLDALHHVGNPVTVIEESARVLRPGGVLVVREFDPLTVRGHALVALEHLVGFESTFWPPDRLADVVRDAGLSVAVPERGFAYTVVGIAPGDGGFRRSKVE